MTVSEQIDKKIADHPDWRGKLIEGIRRLVREADPEILEELKWRGAPTWSHNGLVCVANIFKDTVKVVFASGAKLADPDGRRRISGQRTQQAAIIGRIVPSGQPWPQGEHAERSTARRWRASN